MAWFFQHESCSKKHQRLQDELATVQRQVKELQRDVKDAEDYIVKLSQRVLKRIERAEQKDTPVLDPHQVPLTLGQARALVQGRRP